MVYEKYRGLCQVYSEKYDQSYYNILKIINLENLRLETLIDAFEDFSS